MSNIKNYSEIAYLLRQNKVHVNNKVKIDIDKKYSIKCNGVKKTSNTKKTTPHKLEKQIDVLSNICGDCSVEAKIAKQNYKQKFKDARKKLK